MIQTRKQELEQTLKDVKSEISDINRDEKAKELTDNVIILDHTFAKVVSKNGAKTYNVNYILQTCNCEDETYRQRKCKHIRAVNIVLVEMQIVEIDEYYDIPQEMVITN